VWFVVVVLVVLAVILVALRGAPELARLEVRDGQLSFVRGRLPPGLFGDFADVLSRRRVDRADVRVVLEGGRPRVVASGITADELQQLRNVAGAYTTAQFRSGRAPARRRQ
jgi:hypothetical protein